MEASIPGGRSRDPQSGALIRLRGVFPSLKSALQKVATLILRQPEMAIYASVNEVAAAAGVSEATVMRFCRTLGFKGFQDFKIALARELVAPPPRLQPEAAAGDDPAALVRQVFKADLAAVEETLEVLDLRQLLQAGQALVNCRQLVIGGLRGSGLAAQYAALRFTPLGLDLRCFTETYQMVMAAALMGKEDTFLAVSHSGTTRGILDPARVAMDNDARVLGITSNPLSPLARMADLVLVSAGRGLTGAPDCLAGYPSQIAIIDSLVALVQQSQPDKAQANLAKIERVLPGPL